MASRSAPDRARVLESKLRTPPTLGAAVRRDRLLNAIASQESLGRRVIVLSAPAGAGKTMLLTQWAGELESNTIPSAWLTLDAEDNSSFMFWSGILAACVRALRHDDVLVETLSALRPPVDAADSTFLASFFAAIEPLQKGLWLILDDVHEITDPSVISGLVRLLRNAPTQLRIVLGCRHDLLRPLPRMILDGTATELRASDLAFNDEETRELLRAHGVKLESGDLSLLLDRTEGWAAGLRLAALSLAEQEDVSDYIATLAGDDRPLADYLVTEVLAQHPSDIRAFLLVTAVPQRLTADLARELTGRVDAGAVLDQLAHANVLAYRQDSSPRVYHFHSLLRSYLLAELNRRDATAERRLHTQAADWFARHDAPSLALDHAVAARDWAGVVNLIDRHGLRLRMSGDTVALARALEAAPAEILVDPRVCLVAATAALQDGDLAAGRRHLDRVGRVTSVHDDSRLRLMHASILIHEARLSGERSSRVRALVEETRSHVVDDPELSLLSAANRGMMLITLRDFAAADADLTAALRLAQENGHDLLALECMSHLAVNAAALGDADGMVTRARQAIDFATKHGWASSSSMVRSCVMAAWGSWHAMDLVSADRLMSLAAAVRTDVEPSIALSVGVLDAYIEFALTGNRRTLVDRLEQAWANIEDDSADPMAVSHYCVTDLRVALSTGDKAWENTTVARARRLLGDDSGDVAVVDAMVHTHYERNAAARRELAAVLQGGKTCHVVTTDITAWLLEAHLADVNDEPARAHAAMLRALELAAPVRAVRDVVSGSDRVRQLLIRGNGRFGAHDEFVGEVLAATQRNGTGHLSGHSDVMLTSRELEVLRDLPSRLSLDEIAKAHVVSVNTVKSHLKALYRKLDVASRREAVEQARRLGLI